MITMMKINKAVCTYNNGKWTIDLSEYEKEYWYRSMSHEGKMELRHSIHEDLADALGHNDEHYKEMREMQEKEWKEQEELGEDWNEL